jgi:mannose-6-phosphate isomerase
LHIGQALETIDFSRGPVDPVRPETAPNGIERLVNCDKFVLDRHRPVEPRRLQLVDRFHIFAVVEGDVSLSNEHTTYELRRGDSLLVPAAAAVVEFVPRGRAVVLDMYLP